MAISKSHKPERLYRQYALIIGVILTVAVFVLQFYLQSDDPVIAFITSYAMLGSALGIIIFMVVVRAYYRHPPRLIISAIGVPQSGKTTYLSLLFNEIKHYNEPPITFSYSDQETPRMASHNFNYLLQGKWLPCGKEGKPFSFRANSIAHYPIFRDKFRIEVPDFNSGILDADVPNYEEWIIKTQMMRNSTQSDAIIFLVDSKMLVSAGSERIEQLQNAYISVLKYITKGNNTPQNIWIPVSLLFTKIDAVSALFEPQHLPGMISTLLDKCKRQCKNFRIFYVTSVGKLTIDGLPPDKIEPKKVVDPLGWIMKHYV